MATRYALEELPLILQSSGHSLCLTRSYSNMLRPVLRTISKAPNQEEFVAVNMKSKLQGRIFRLSSITVSTAHQEENHWRRRAAQALAPISPKRKQSRRNRTAKRILRRIRWSFIVGAEEVRATTLQDEYLRFELTTRPCDGGIRPKLWRIRNRDKEFGSNGNISMNSIDTLPNP